jgi:hypothetical protein
MTEFKGDKRTKAYKEWKAKYEKQSKGFGDTVEKITEATGIKKAVKFLAGEDCGCDERKDKLNYLFPYQKPNCFTEQEFNYLIDYFASKPNKLTVEKQTEVLEIYNRVFNDKRELSSCSTCFLNGVHKKLERLFKEYQD